MLHDVLAICSSSLVDFVLGLIGGGGSILAVPLLVYVVGIRSSHVAIGTSSVAVALSALSSLAGHARAGNVRSLHPHKAESAGFTGLQRVYWCALHDAVSVFVTGH
jgi:Sulfite exporter TauE/SafE